MSVEYYTIPALPFEEAKLKLLAALGERYVVEKPSRYKPECEGLLLAHPNGARMWALKETRPHRNMNTVGSIIFEVMMPSLDLEHLKTLMPWVEETLGVKVVDEFNLGWED